MDQSTNLERPAIVMRRGIAFSLVLAVAFCLADKLPLAMAGEPAPMVTGSLPNDEDTMRQGGSVGMPREAPSGRLLVLGFAGDVGFSGKDQPIVSTGSVRHGRVIPWQELTSGVKPLLSADATFANLETVIAERTDLTPVDKAFNFAAGPQSLIEAVKAGINVMAAANNHAADFGENGIEETLRHLEAARAAGLKAHVGLGKGDARYRSDVFDLQGTSIGLAATGRGINPAGPDGHGQPLYASLADFERTVRSLGSTQADVRVLSVHYNEELSLLPEVADKRRLRLAVDRGDATIVFGHHSHVASGVERRGEALIFYGLGNFLHAGTQNMARYGQCRDFGLYARVYLWTAAGRKPVLRAVEITPILDMHEITKPFPAEEAAIRIAVVNAMSEELSRDGGEPLRFMPTDTGSGLACLPGPAIYGDELEERCRVQSRPFADVSSETMVSLATCKALPPVDASAGTRNDQRKTQQPGAQSTQKLKPVPKQVRAKPERAKVKVKPGPDQKKETRSFFLFSRAE